MAETNYDQQVRLVEAALSALGAVEESSVRERSAAILGWVKANHPDEGELLRKSWSTYLSRAVADPATRVRRLRGTYTYYLSEVSGVDDDLLLEAQTPPPGASHDVGRRLRQNE